jgi:hypothetical protein
MLAGGRFQIEDGSLLLLLGGLTHFFHLTFEDGHFLL